MAEPEQGSKNDFMIEKIKERPINKKKLVRRMLITAAMAVIFGLIASLTFLVLEPVLSNWLYPEEAPDPIVIPEESEEMSPEEMLSDIMQEKEAEDIPEPQALEEEKIQEILSGFTFQKENYEQLYTALSAYVAELSQYMVKITGVTSDVDWFQNVTESQRHTSGVIIANHGAELLILADYAPIKKAEKLTLTFFNNVQIGTQLKAHDANTDLAVLSVNIAGISPEIREGFRIVSLGTSNFRTAAGRPVVAMGSPMGSSDSVGYGIISAPGSLAEMTDANYRILVTDIYGSRNAGGILFNLESEVIGIITNQNGSPGMENLVRAYGISDLKKLIEKMSNGQKCAYLGITGSDVSKEANEDLKVPYGAYVKEVEMESPAMLAGIQQGDVIVGIGADSVANFSEYTAALMKREPGENVQVTVLRRSQEEYKEMEFEMVLGEL
jgi:serine protease Do